MLVPLTRKAFEQVIPIIATGQQYKYYWGKPSDCLRRVLFSLTGVVGVTVLHFAIVRLFFEDAATNISFILGFIVGLYWLWSPIYFATRRNWEARRYKYSGFWQGEVFDVFFTEELVGTEETVNKRGDLVVVENRERCLNLEVGDETGFSTKLQVPVQRDHRGIRPGDVAEMVVMSNRRDLSLISKVSDIYLPDYDLWVADYPTVQRQAFEEVSQRLNDRHNRDRWNSR